MIEGTDLSVYTRNVDYARMRQAGIRFAINKLGQGTTITDPLSITHREGCKSQGVFWDWFYFGDYRTTPAPQATRHIDMMNGRFGWGQLITFVDLEYEERLGWGRPSGYNMLMWLRGYRNTFYKLAPGKPLGLYTNPELIHGMRPYLRADDLEMPLWLAHWTTEKYIDCEPWKSWIFWQQAGDVLGPWATGGVDYDYFNGTEADLAELAHAQPVLTLEQKVDKLWREGIAHGWNL